MRLVRSNAKIAKADAKAAKTLASLAALAFQA